MFKPTRPPEVDAILRSYAHAHVPYFFRYAKDKKKDAVESPNQSMMNRIVYEIADDNRVLKELRHLARVDYLMLLKNKVDLYENEEVNKAFDKWNKKYGNNLNIDEENYDKTNISAISQAIKHDMKRIEPDEDKVVNSLVNMFYKKRTLRKKKLFWYVYGDKLLDNIYNNLDEQEICRVCGKRVREELINDQCVECRKREMKETDGMKMIQCVDCGVEFLVGVKNTRTCRCDDCRSLYRKEYLTIKKREFRSLSTDQN